MITPLRTQRCTPHTQTELSYLCWTTSPGVVRRSPDRRRSVTWSDHGDRSRDRTTEIGHVTGSRRSVTWPDHGDRSRTVDVARPLSAGGDDQKKVAPCTYCRLKDMNGRTRTATFTCSSVMAALRFRLIPLRSPPPAMLCEARLREESVCRSSRFSSCLLYCYQAFMRFASHSRHSELITSKGEAQSVSLW